MKQIIDGWFPENTTDFESEALQVFNFQYDNNNTYRAYVNAVYNGKSDIHTISDIPFLPITLFKSLPVTTATFQPELIFESSGTTGAINSKHFVKEAAIYKRSFMRCFELFYGDIKEWCILGLLPSYLERGNSSLIYMVDHLIKESANKYSGFYLNELDALATVIKILESEKQKTLLIGVTFALLDFAALHSMKLHNTIIMETGGMKGRKKEMVRAAVHAALKKSFQVPAIHSEYGMTELLSQAYSKGEGVFACPPWMKIMLREEEDPLSIITNGNKGVINIIDLANIYSCSFIATDDLGVLYPDNSFEVLGRMDNSDIRGCSLLAL